MEKAFGDVSSWMILRPIATQFRVGMGRHFGYVCSDAAWTHKLKTK
jgi:hypothetical protein